MFGRGHLNFVATRLPSREEAKELLQDLGTLAWAPRDCDAVGESPTLGSVEREAFETLGKGANEGTIGTPIAFIATATMSPLPLPASRLLSHAMVLFCNLN
jgi:hypothetical protein